MSTLPIAATLLTKNSEKHLHRVLSSLTPFAEIVVYDTGSTDGTLEILSSFPNVRVERGILEGFGPTHNRLSSLASYDWIFSIDSDEVATEELIATLRSLSLDPQSVYSFPRKNFFRGQWIRGCGWYPDRQIRLYHRKRTRFSDAFVHEKILTEGMRQISLTAPILHYSYDCVADFLQKMELYTSLFAKQQCGKRQASYGKALAHGAFAFVKSFLIQLGIRDGWAGLEISLYNASTAFYKYLKLWEANLQVEQRSGDAQPKRGELVTEKGQHSDIQGEKQDAAKKRAPVANGLDTS